MAIPNLIALILLAPLVFRLTREYRVQPHGQTH
jgi:Na+/alanine symporter